MAIESFQASTGTLYLGFRDGFLVSKPKGGEAPEELKEFTNQNGSKTIRKLHGPLVAKIDDINVRDGQYGKELMIWMSDGPEKYCLQLKANSWTAMDFYKIMEGIDFSEEVRIVGATRNGYSNLYVQQRLSEPVTVTFDGKNKTYAKGEWKAVPWQMKYEEIPEAKDVTVNGQTVKDKTAMLNYFAPRLKKVMERLETLKSVPEPTEGEADLSDVDDLPF